MKRGGFLQRKTPLKASEGFCKRKSTLKKESKASISKLQRDLWAECKRIIRARHGNTCYTCGRKDLAGSNWHTGHMWAKASLPAYLKYDLRILRPQCYHDNINLGGRGADFYSRMLAEIGPEAMAQLEADRQKSVKAYSHYEGLLEHYRTL